MLGSKKLLFVTFALCTFDFCRGLAISDYLRIREKAIEDEEASFFGGDLKLDEDEAVANKYLMSIKKKEIDEGYKNLSKFYPSRDFLEVRKDIEQTETYKLLRRMPKGAALHIHLGESVSLDYIYDHLTIVPNLYVCLENETVLFQFFETPNKNCKWQLVKDVRTHNPEIIDSIKKNLTLPTLSRPGLGQIFWSRFEAMEQAFDGIITYRPAYEKYVQRSIEELYEDNVMYIEMRSFSYELYELNGTIHDPIVAVRIFKRVVDEFVASHPDFVGVKLIFTVNRQLDREEFNKQVELFRRIRRAFPEFVIGFDMSHNEDGGHPLVYFLDTLLELGKETSFYFHAGETKWFGHPVDENLFDAVMLNSKRIGHGVALLKHPNLVERIKQRGIAIEVNPISSQMGDYPDLRSHPASHYFAKNLPIVVSSDDPSYWNASGLSYDFYEAFIGIMSRKSDLRSLKQLAINSITYSAMKDEERKVAMKVWSKSWTRFIKDFAKTKLNNH